MNEVCCSALKCDKYFQGNVKWTLCNLHGRQSRTKWKQEFPERSNHFMDQEQTLGFAAQRSDCGLNLDGSSPLDFRNPKILQKARCSLDTVWRISNWIYTEYKLQMSSLQNKIHPCLHFNDRCFFPCCFLSTDGPLVQPQNRLQLDTEPISELMSTKPKPKASGGK